MSGRELEEAVGLDELAREEDTEELPLTLEEDDAREDEADEGAAEDLLEDRLDDRDDEPDPVHFP